MLYLVDGYNVTRSDDATRRLPLDRQRDALVARMRVRGPDMLGRGRIVVVFDGTPDAGEQASGGADVEVVFSRGDSADDVIVRLAAGAREKVVLVSSDAELRQRVEAVAQHGAELRRCNEAWERPGGSSPRAKQAKGRGRNRFPASTVGLPHGANKITEEMKRLWLGDEATGVGDDREESDS